MRRIRVGSLVIILTLAVSQSWIASAQTIKTGPYDKAEQGVNRSPDAMGFGTVDGTGTADTAGSLATSASVDSTAPAGAVVPYVNTTLFASGVTAFGRIIQKMTTSGAGTFSIKADFTGVTGSTSSTKNAYDPVVGYYCLDCATSSAYPVAYASVRATYYPCQWSGASPTCYPSTYKDSYKYLAEAAGGTLSPAVSVTTAFTGSGTILVTASLVSSASARGTGSADASISGTLASITLNP